MTHHLISRLLRGTAAAAALLTTSASYGVLIGFEAEDGSSVTTTATATIGADYLPANTDGFALGGEYLTRSGNGGLSAPDTSSNVLSYDVNFTDAGEYDLYARVLFEVDGSDDSFYYGNGFGAKDPTLGSDWVRPNGLPDAGFPAATYFWINLSENLGQFPAGTATTFTVAAPGVQTIQFGGREDGLYFDAFAFGTAADTFTDQQLTESVTNIFSPPNQWNLPGGGSFNTAANWSDNIVPTFDALLADSITEDAEVTLDTGVSLNSVAFNNSNNAYTLAGPNPLGLVAAAQVSTTGSHTITADVTGSAGLNKLGAGVLNLSGAKGYTGATNVQEGTLALNDLAAIDNQASGVLNIAAGAAVNLEAGATGTLAAQLTGASTVDDDAVLRIGSSLADGDTVTLSRSNAGFGGVIRVDGGQLAVTNSNALGDGGEENDRTVIQQGSTAKVALSNNVSIANEVLDFEGRATNDAALTSTGSNAWSGVIRGEGSGSASRGNIESTSGTLTLNRLFAEDTNELFTYVFSGAGNTTVTGRISDANIDIDADIVTVKQNDNVGVTKRGTGTLTIGYASSAENDYWFGPTSIEQGTMVVNASGGADGELRSSSISVSSGATLNISAFTQYTQQIDQDLRGAGTINVGSGNLRLISDGGDLAPGDGRGKVGELTISSGSVSLTDPTAQGTGTWTFDVGNNTNTATDRLNVQSGAFTVSTSAVTFNISPAAGHLDAGSRTIVSHTGGAASTINGATARITDANGNPLTTRQSVSINGSTAGQVNVVVTGEEQSRTWAGGVSGAWDVSTSNWTGGDQQFRDLDHVTFNDSASTNSVTLAENRAPGSMTFANSTPYSITGDGAIVGSGPINVTGSGEVTLGNAGNDFRGATTINAGSSLRMRSASTGSITNSGTLSLGVPETVHLLVQNSSEEIGANGYKAFAFEAEDFHTLTENAPGDTTWVVRSDIAGSSGLGPDGEALYASEDPSNTATSTAAKNFTTYNMQFTEPGSYMWFFHAVSTDGGNPGTTPDGDAGNDDSFYTVSGDMDSGNADPTVLGSRIDNFGSARLAAEGVIAGSSGSLDYDWYRNGDSGGNAGEFHRINVSQSDVDAGTVFKFKVGTREGGMTLDKFVFVADADYGTDPNFGTLTDLDLDGATSITSSEETFIAAGTLLEVDGDFTMTADSVLNMLISTPGTHDQLDISGMLSADGTLNVEAGGNGFSAVDGDVFDLFAFDSVTGSFTIGSLPSLAAGLDWDTSNLTVTGELAVVYVGLPGDFNGDNIVDAADYTVWRDNQGPTEGDLLAGNGDGGTIGQSDYDLWAQNYGATLGGAPPAGATVPEPTALAASLLLAAAGLARRRRRV